MDQKQWEKVFPFIWCLFMKIHLYTLQFASHHHCRYHQEYYHLPHMHSTKWRHLFALHHNDIIMWFYRYIYSVCFFIYLSLKEKHNKQTTGKKIPKGKYISFKQHSFMTSKVASFKNVMKIWQWSLLYFCFAYSSKIMIIFVILPIFPALKF